MKITKWFIITIVVGIFAQIIGPSIGNLFNPSDSPSVFYGFPIAIYSSGGWPNYSHNSFSIIGLIVDIILVFGLAFGINFVTEEKNN